MQIRAISALRRKLLEQDRDWEAAAALWLKCYKQGDASARLRQGECLHRAGRFKPATRVVLSTLTGDPAVDQASLDLLAAFVRREAGKRATESIDLLLPVPSGLAGLTRAFQHLHMLWYIGMSQTHPQAMALCEAVLSDPPSWSSEVLHGALELLWLYQGPSAELLDRLRKTLPDGERQQLELQLLAALGAYDDCLTLLRAAPDRLEDALTIPGLPERVLAAADLALPKALRERMEQARRRYARAERQRAQLWEKLADPDVSIAVVGNSPIELGQGRGEEIDGHDLVVRFNHFSLEPQHQQDYGRRVSVVVRTRSDDVSYDLGVTRSHDVIISFSLPEPLNVKQDVAIRLADKGFKVSWFYPEVFWELAPRLGALSSSGLRFIWSLQKFRKDMRRVDFYGFAFTDQIGPNAGTAHYFDDGKPSSLHNWQAERKVFDEIISERDRQRLTLPAVVRPILPKVRIVGDHSDYHCGSAAVIGYLHKSIGRRAILVNDDTYDILIINGEGSLHHRSRSYRNKLRVARQALTLGRPYHIINTVWQENGAEDRDVMAGATSLVVREVLSQRALKAELGLDSVVCPDLSFFQALDEDAPFQDFKNSTVVTDFHSSAFETFVRLTEGPLAKWPYLDMKSTTWSTLVLSLRTASLLVTGRHHAVYAACRARLPFVALTGNTHKIEGLIASAGVDIPVCRHPAELPKAIKAAAKRRDAYEALFDWLESQSPWRADQCFAT